MKRIEAGDLDVAYLDVGPADGPPVILLHGFPYDVHAYDASAALLAAAGRRCIVPYLRGCGPTRFRSADTFRSGQQAALGTALWPERVTGLLSCGTGYNIQDLTAALEPSSPEAERRGWYWYYLNSERGRRALEGDRARFCRFLWAHFSPTWSFGDDEYAATAAAFDNPDFVDVVLHSYRVRIGSVPGDPTLDATERRLAAKPKITVPTAVLMGQDDGIDPPLPRPEVETHFSRLRDVQSLPGIGHNVPQEAPGAFADALLALDPH